MDVGHQLQISQNRQVFPPPVTTLPKQNLLSKFSRLVKETFSKENIADFKLACKPIKECSKKIFNTAMKIMPFVMALGVIACVLAAPICPLTLVGIPFFLMGAVASANHMAKSEHKSLATQGVEQRVIQHRAEYRNQSKALQEQKDKIAPELREKTAKKTSLEGEISQLKIDLNIIQARVQSVDDAVGEQTTKLHDLQNQNQMGAPTQAIIDSEKKLKELKAQQEDIQSKHSKAKKKLDDVRTEKAQVVRELEQIGRGTVNVNKRLADLELTPGGILNQIALLNGIQERTPSENGTLYSLKMKHYQILLDDIEKDISRYQSTDILNDEHKKVIDFHKDQQKEINKLIAKEQEIQQQLNTVEQVNHVQDVSSDFDSDLDIDEVELTAIPNSPLEPTRPLDTLQAQSIIDGTAKAAQVASQPQGSKPLPSIPTNAQLTSAASSVTAPRPRGTKPLPPRPTKERA